MYKTNITMEEKRIVAAIDVGTTKIVVLIGRKNDNGGIEILGYGRTASHGVKRGQVQNINDTIKSISAAVKQAEDMANCKITEAYVGIAGQHIRSQRYNQSINRNSANDAISEADVEALISQMREVPTEMGEEVLHILPQSYSVDTEFGIKNPVGIAGKQLSGNFHIVFGNTAAANNLRKCVESNGIKVKGLILEPLASSTSVLTNNDRELGVALVDIGGGTTDVAIYRDGSIYHTAVIPYGGDSVTGDIRQGCKIIEEDAEILKIQYGSAIATEKMNSQSVTIPGRDGLKAKEISVSMLANIIRARMEEIIATVMEKIEVSGTKHLLGAGIVITGGGAMLQNLTQLFALRSGMEVRIGVPNKRILPKEKITSLPSNATSIGLLTMGIEEIKIEGLGFDTESKIKIEETKPETNNIETEDKAAKPIANEQKKPKLVEKIKNYWDSFTEWATEVNDEHV